MTAPPLLVLTGTTASGKNRVGVLLARSLGAEIVSLDSMKVYRGMDVGTDKPGAADRAAVRHHLLDVCDPKESMNLRRFVELADAALEDIRRRGRRPVAVGGTALYLNGLLRGVFDGPQADPAFRRGLRAEAGIRGAAALHGRLRALDPEAAARIHPNDYRRIERALEVYALCGRPISSLQGQWGRDPARPHRMVVLTWPRPILDRRINERVGRMFERGLLDEVRGLVARGGLGREASQALGYREALAHLRGEVTVSEMAELIRNRTRRFARRQLTWFRRWRDAAVIEGREGEGPEELAERIRRVHGAAVSGPGPSRPVE